jgi:RNA recognition motif-containing protein
MLAEFSMIGTVTSFSIVTDRESGQPKGFGFCNFADADSARSAVRQMDRIQFRGRTLRVALADEAAAGIARARICLDLLESSSSRAHHAHSFARDFPFSASLSGGEQTDVKPGAAAALTTSGPRTLTEQDHVDIVASAVNLLTHQQRVEFLAQMKVHHKHG